MNDLTRMADNVDHDAYSDDYIRGILSSVKSIAVVGAATNPVRPSHIVVRYLIGKGYRVFPINPGHAGKDILGRKVYARLADVPQPIDMVDIFRKPEAIPGVVDEALALDPLPSVIWMQLTLRDDAGGREGRGRRPQGRHEPLRQDRIWTPVRRDLLVGRQFPHHLLAQARPRRRLPAPGIGRQGQVAAALDRYRSPARRAEPKASGAFCHPSSLKSGVELKIFVSSSVISAGTSANSGVDR